MAAKGRGRARKGTTRKVTESPVDVESTVPDSALTATGLSRFSASQTFPENVEKNVENQCFDHKAVEPSKMIHGERTPLSPLHEPLATNVVARSVPDLGLKRTEMGKRRPLQVVKANGAVSPSPSPSLHTSDCTREYEGRVDAVKQICDAIDAEVQARHKVIKAIASAQLHSITSQLRLQLSRLPVHVQNMPLDEYLKSFPNIVSKELDDGRIQLQKASPGAAFLRGSKKNLSDMLSMANDNLTGEPVSLLNTPGFGPIKTSVSHLHSFTSEDLSWSEYHAKLQALGHIGGYPASSGTQQDSAVSLKTGLFRGMTPKTVRIPKEGEVLLSLNGSPLGQFGFTPGPYIGNVARSRKLPETRATRSTTKRSLRDL